MMKIHKDGYYNAICCVCGKKVHRKPHELKKIKNVHCSKECFAKAKKKYMKGTLNHQYGLRGENNSSWKGGRKISSYGYILIYKPEHPFANGDGNIFEHRLVAEEFLLDGDNSIEVGGIRYLSPEYEVHHKNGNKKDNSVENLVVLSKEEHRRLHNKMNLKYMVRDRKGRIASICKNKKEGIRIKLKQNAKKPTVATKYSAGFDLYCAEEKEITVNPGEVYIFDTGVSVELQKGTFGGLYARSGLSTKQGMMLVNGVGIIDADYRNSIKVPLRNMGDKPQTIKPNDRIAQLIVQKFEEVEFDVVDELSPTKRGTGGFGSTGR